MWSLSLQPKDMPWIQSMQYEFSRHYSLSRKMIAALSSVRKLAKCFPKIVGAFERWACHQYTHVHRSVTRRTDTHITYVYVWSIYCSLNIHKTERKSNTATKVENVELKFILQCECVRCCRRMIIIEVQFLFIRGFLAQHHQQHTLTHMHKIITFRLLNHQKKGRERKKRIFSSASTACWFMIFCGIVCWNMIYLKWKTIYENNKRWRPGKKEFRIKTFLSLSLSLSANVKCTTSHTRKSKSSEQWIIMWIAICVNGNVCERMWKHTAKLMERNDNKLLIAREIRKWTLARANMLHALSVSQFQWREGLLNGIKCAICLSNIHLRITSPTYMIYCQHIWLWKWVVILWSLLLCEIASIVFLHKGIPIVHCSFNVITLCFSPSQKPSSSILVCASQYSP